MAFELYASGFNAWNQLRFPHPDLRLFNRRRKDQPAVTTDDSAPDDITSFTCVLKGLVDVIPLSFLSHTAIFTDGDVITAGAVPSEHSRFLEADKSEDKWGYLYFFAEASNGLAVKYEYDDSDGSLIQYPSTQALIARQPGEEFPSPSGDIRQVVAYDAGFAALTLRGSVWTWGDERYPACLCRKISDASPAGKPGLVASLENLPTGPIRKLVASSYVLAALTAGNDLYCWGDRIGHLPLPEDIDGQPVPMTVNGMDIVDVGVGESHMIVLTDKREVYVVGDGQNGQLGLGDITSANSWTRVNLGLGRDQIIKGVAAGPRSSLIMVENKEWENRMLRSQLRSQ